MSRHVSIALMMLAVTGLPAVAVEVNPQFLPLYQPLAKRIGGADNTKEQIDLGRMLYYEKRLSLGQDISCNSCHDLKAYGVDGKATSPGHKGQLGTRNSPTVYNAAGHYAQFWDGRAATIEDQAVMPILNPIEMAMPEEEYVLKVLKSIPGYVEAFKEAFPEDPEPITYPNVGKAIGAFERGLVTPAPWDSFLAGEKSAISDEAKAGFNAFIQAQCFTCHMGPYVGGNLPQKLGMVRPWPSQKDQGRYEVTKNEGDRMIFKSASLRNITRTAPYFHDGSVESLEEAIKMMGLHQLGRPLPDAEIKKIVAWLETLTGEIPMDYIEQPELPPNGPDTPAPKLD